MYSSARRRQLAAIAIALVLVPAALWIEMRLSQAAVVGTDVASTRLLFFVQTPVILGLALFGGAASGLFAVLLSIVLGDYFLFAPGELFRVHRAGEAVALLCFTGVTVPVVLLAGRLGRRLQEKDERRLAAERVAARADIIEQITAALSRAVQPADAIEASVQEAAHWLKAQAGALLLVSEDGQRLMLARAIGYSEALETGLHSVEMGDRGPMRDAVMRRAPVYIESLERYEAEYGDADDLLTVGEHQAAAIVPLIASAGVLAIVRLDFRAPRAFNEEEKDILAQLAPRAAQALDRTRQHEFAQRARADAELHRQRADQELEERLKTEQALRTSENRYRSLAARTSRLHALTAALSESVAVEAVARAVVERGRVVVGATASDVMLLVEEGATFHTVYSDPRDGVGARMAVDEGLCATEAVRTRTPVFIRTFEELQERCWRSAVAAADGGYNSSATLPLLVEGTAIGVLSFHFTVPVNFDEEYQALLVSVAQHCAQAIDRARLYESAQSARADAEQANRLKDDFLSIVSHELRTPLSSILGWTSILQRPAIDPTVASRAVQSIRDNATRQAKLVEDLLDFSRIVAGRLMLDRQKVSVRDLLRGVIEAVVPVAAAQRINIDYLDAPNVTIDADPRRLEQIFLNLLGNAVKFTPEGGRIDIVVTPGEQEVQICVSDSGVGIDPEFLPHVFERFRQGEPSASRTHDGVGLGLSITKQLVEAHGGTISVASEGRGRGTSFLVTLPAAGWPKEPAHSWRFADSERAGV
jgi:K+-sensing histidine kinase KdpD